MSIFSKGNAHVPFAIILLSLAGFAKTHGMDIATEIIGKVSVVIHDNLPPTASRILITSSSVRTVGIPG